jgi:transposase-like protein
MDSRRFRFRDTFETDEQCWTYLEAARWPEGVRCLRCGSVKVSKFVSGSPARRLYQCNAPKCRYQFSAITGTAFAGSHLPLRTWFRAIAMVAEATGEVSAAAMQRDLGVSYRTAWYLKHRLREAMHEAKGRPDSARSGSSAGRGDDTPFRESSR